MKPIEELAREAGMEAELWNMGAASCVYTEGCEGVGRDALERFAALVLEEAAMVADSTREYWDSAELRAIYGVNSAAAIRALAVPKE